MPSRSPSQANPPLRNYLPFTSLHILSNGRFFSYLTYCQELAELAHPNLMVGIPLNSDVSHEHNFIVQADGAYDETIRGLMNLARVGVAIELRVVINKVNADRLISIASFISRNLPFCRHVAFMGLEPTGLARKNLSILWVDPYEYKDSLSSAVEILSTARMNVSIYNHALCVLNKETWPYARKSISDWKCEFLEQCDGCAVKMDCGGFFSSALSCHSSHIKAESA
jgi:His-Xaa-Ser system radical SAM maturase HxsC